MKRLLLLAITWMAAFAAQAQLLTWTPDFAQENSAITITVDATKGNRALIGFTGNVYVHIGLITSASTNEDDWKYSQFTWGSATPAAQATSLGNNKWSFSINHIRNYFGVTNANERILAIAILFRDASGNTVQRNANQSVYNGNMYVPVYDDGLHLRFAQPPMQPYYQAIPEEITRTVGQNIPVTAVSSKPATINIYFNGTLQQTASNVSSLSASPTVTATGNQELVIEAINGPATAKDTIGFFVAGTVVTEPQPAGTRDGINYLAGNTSVVLVLHAPGKNRVSVIGEFPGSAWLEQSQFQMKRTPDAARWWVQIDGLTPGVEYAYQYLVDGNLKIADPYAEKILDPYNNNDGYISASTYPNLRSYPTGQSGIVSLLQTAAPAYNWTVNNFVRPDKRNLMVYELLVRDFIAAHDWTTLKDTLQYLKRMGINAIEIMPFNEFEGNESWGYNPDFYFAPDKYYGPRNTLKQFVDVCHANGIAVIMDIALNHSYGLSPMVQLYWDGANNRPAANNPWYNPTPKHAFNVGFDFNHESAATQYFFSRVAEHWLKEYKLDGFRFDLSKGFTQVNTCDANGNNCNVNNWGNYDASRVAIWKRYYDTLMLKSPGSYVVLEHFAANNEEIELSNYGMLFWGNSHYNFTEAAKGVIANSNFEGALHSSRGWTQPHLMSYMESHDEERIAHTNITQGLSSGGYNVRDTTTSLKRLALNTAFFLSMPGPKMIWQFGELGYDFPINYCPDGTINNDCRTSNKPIRWDYRQQARRLELYNVYSELGKLRAHPWYKDVFTANNISLEKNLSAGLKWMKIKSATDSSMLCVIGNFELTAQTISFTFPAAGNWFDYFNNTVFSATSNTHNISLAPGEFRVYVNRNVNNVSVTPVFDVDEPAKFLQAAAYPNPVAASSIVELNIPQTGLVQVQLLDMSGRVLETLHQGQLVRGNHSVPIGNKLNKYSSGLYLLRIVAGKDSQILKTIIP